WTEDGRGRRQGMVLRIEPSGFTVFPAYDVGQQFRIMQRLGEATDVPVPSMYWLEERTDVLGARFFVMGKVDGRIPPDNPPYHAAGWMTEIAAGRARCALVGRARGPCPDSPARLAAARLRLPRARRAG